MRRINSLRSLGCISKEQTQIFSNTSGLKLVHKEWALAWLHRSGSAAYHCVHSKLCGLWGWYVGLYAVVRQQSGVRSGTELEDLDAVSHRSSGRNARASPHLLSASIHHFLERSLITVFTKCFRNKITLILLTVLGILYKYGLSIHKLSHIDLEGESQFPSVCHFLLANNV